MSDCIDIHTHVVPENFPAYAGKGRDLPWPAKRATRCTSRADPRSDGAAIGY